MPSADSRFPSRMGQVHSNDPRVLEQYSHLTLGSKHSSMSEERGGEAGCDTGGGKGGISPLKKNPPPPRF